MAVSESQQETLELIQRASGERSEGRVLNPPNRLLYLYQGAMESATRTIHEHPTHLIGRKEHDNRQPRDLTARLTRASRHKWPSRAAVGTLPAGSRSLLFTCFQ